ncbi:hypothetical protein QP794_24280 [Paenibacillus sp. UMB7766-LJ446]|uniref:hypothetical protein n=1 Tax=Paenibacillus sp. UMB7766-LJ446 TaxID=3046313 RepID=UPI00254A400D|nr:hypothetical protein [Paenibacillus sp. UMB7766-LJ446]MDK8193209.1 hypothetical protein [Paenibacillus sp. UMB7766-LJ446]
MRNPNRIHPFMDLLQECWLCFPDLRFNQLISIIFKEFDDSTVFNMEEEEATDVIQRFMIEYKDKYIHGDQ